MINVAKLCGGGLHPPEKWSFGGRRHTPPAPVFVFIILACARPLTPSRPLCVTVQQGRRTHSAFLIIVKGRGEKENEKEVSGRGSERQRRKEERRGRRSKRRGRAREKEGGGGAGARRPGRKHSRYLKSARLGPQSAPQPGPCKKWICHEGPRPTPPPPKKSKKK